MDNVTLVLFTSHQLLMMFFVRSSSLTPWQYDFISPPPHLTPATDDVFGEIQLSDPLAVRLYLRLISCRVNTEIIQG